MLQEIVEDLNAGRDFREIFDALYARLHGQLPCSRLAVALYDEATDRLSLYACRSDGPQLLREGYSATMKGSSLEVLLQTGEPRIINDLQEYLHRKPASAATALIVREGMRSSLSLPLIARGRAVGVLFFSSRSPNAYTAEHAALTRLLAGHISVALERSIELARLKHMQEELARAQSLAAVGELAATVAHEIKNPLAGISGAIQVLAEAFPAGDSRREVITEILAQVKRLDDTVRDLLVFSRPWKPEMHETDLVEVIDRAAGLLRRKGVTVTRETPETMPVTGDSQQLQEVLLNLFLNAADAMPRGGVVRVVGETNGQATLRIIDAGTGISAEQRGRLFRPFFTTKTRGTGLGLAISKKIVEAHGGAITIDSEIGRGTEVKITIPKEWNDARSDRR